MLLSVVLMLGTGLLVSEAANLTTDLQLLEQTGSTWEGRFCFHLPTPTLGFRVSLTFSEDVKNIKLYDTALLSGSVHDCGKELEVVNKESSGQHGTGLYCLKMAGLLCSPTGTTLTAVGTFVDLTHTPMQVPDPPLLSAAMKYNYAEVLQKSILFYEGQRSGRLPADNRVPWRGDSALQDRGLEGEDLTGGWYDAGDNMKYNFPMASATTVLCWGLLEFSEAYDAAGQLDYMFDSIRWPLEYFIKCHTKPNELYVQVGSTKQDHNQWIAPEAMTYKRTAFKVDAQHPGSEVAMEMAAAMACGAIAFTDKDANFSATLLETAQSLYTLGKNHPGRYHLTLPNEEVIYRSNGVADEAHWGAIWMYKATRDEQYLQDAILHYDHNEGWGFSWDEKTAGNHMLMYEITEEEKYRTDVELYLNSWMPHNGLQYTPHCLAFRNRWGDLRYAANTAFLGLMAAQKGINADQYNQWALCQIHYALGDAGHSFVVGFGTNPPSHIHHRGSSCPALPAPCGWGVFNSHLPNPDTLYGALVGGPDQNGVYRDVRTDYVHNEVAVDYNAGFQGAVAALLQLALETKLPNADQCGQC